MISMVSQDQKNKINEVILDSLGYNKFSKDKPPEEYKDIERYFKISEKDYEEILRRKAFAEDQIKNDFEYLTILIALRRYSSEIEQEVIDTNSSLGIDNFDEALKSYVRSYL